jgi:hypothetical protein
MLQLLVVVTGLVLMVAGLLFAFSSAGVAGEAGGGAGPIKLSAPPWLMLVAFGIGLLWLGTVQMDSSSSSTVPTTTTTTTTEPFYFPEYPDIGDAVYSVPNPYDYGDDSVFDEYWRLCEFGDGYACDLLFQQSPVGSVYEEYGATCGFIFVEWLANECEFALQ